MKKLLVTGANGLLGQKLVKKVLAEGKWELCATGRGECRIETDKPLHYVSADLSSESAVRELIANEKPDVIIHGAAMTQVDDCEKDRDACWLQNVKVVEYLVNACEDIRPHFIHLSTDFIFDGTSGPYKEDDTPNPISFYGESKLASEEVVRDSGLDWAIARTVLVYGIVPNMSRSNIILWVKKSLEEGKELKIVDDQFRSPTLAEDLASGCLLIAEKGATGIYNLSGPDEALTPYDMAMATVDYFNLNGSLITRADSSTFSQPARRPPKTGFDISRARKELGYAPHSFKEGIAILAGQISQ